MIADRSPRAVVSGAISKVNERWNREASGSDLLPQTFAVGLPARAAELPNLYDRGSDTEIYNVRRSLRERSLNKRVLLVRRSGNPIG